MEILCEKEDDSIPEFPQNKIEKRILKNETRIKNKSK